MDRIDATKVIGAAAKSAWALAPKGPEKFALHCLVWAPRNILEKGEQFTAGHLQGILNMGYHTTPLPAAIASAMFVVSESLAYPGAVPREQIALIVEGLGALYAVERVDVG